MVSRTHGKECLMTLYEKIIKLHDSLKISDFDFGGTIELRNDGDGDYIAKWNHKTIKQPTQSELDAVE
jgi:beta-mannanase